MRRLVGAVGSAVLRLAATACGGDGGTEKEGQSVTGVFFGVVCMTTHRVGLAVDAPKGGEQHVGATGRSW